ncbi:hypothetical protein QL285_078577 [Trifolium repens]|nr:hypothetical protein QL285_078577 [Trifolium repens]
MDSTYRVGGGFLRGLNFILITNSGHIVDCVDINNQPAFDHFLLKNHKLQRKPNFESNINETSIKSSPNLIYWLENVRCPKGTVPIQRITKDDLIRGKSVFNDHNLSQKGSTVHEAYVLNAVLENIHAIKGTTSIYNPKVDNGQSSAGHLYVQTAYNDATNKIVVGWHSDNFKSIGCYNMLCKGFVQTDRSYYLGSRIRRTSTYGGEMIEMPISLHKDRASHNWWLTVADKIIGYFPAALFSKWLNLMDWDGVGSQELLPVLLVLQWDPDIFLIKISFMQVILEMLEFKLMILENITHQMDMDSLIYLNLMVLNTMEIKEKNLDILFNLEDLVVIINCSNQCLVIYNNKLRI